jgi:hypothetical protein
LKIRDAKGAASIWDCETGEVREIGSAGSSTGYQIKLEFKPLEAYWLVIDPLASESEAGVETNEPKNLITIAVKWKVTYNPAIQPKMEFSAAPPPEFKEGTYKPLEDWKLWGMEKFSGLMDYSVSASIDPGWNSILLDLGKVCHTAEVWINGQPVGSRMWGPYLFDITSAVKPGQNDIRIRVANLINNSYGDIQESGLTGPVKIAIY